MRGPEWGHVTCNVYIFDGMNQVAEEVNNGDVSRDRDNELLLVKLWLRVCERLVLACQLSISRRLLGKYPLSAV